MNEPVYSLYGYFRSSTSYRVRIALEFKGLKRAVDWNYVPVHLVRDGGEQYKDDYRSLNPVGEVPTLVVHGEQDTPLAQSVAILEFLEERHPDPPLLPEDDLKRARVRQVVEVINSSIHPVQNLKVMRQLTEDFGTNREANFHWAMRWIDRHFIGLDELVGRLGGPYAAGAEITMADVALVPQVFNADRFGVSMERFPHLRRAYELAMEDAAFQAAAPGNQPDSV